MNICREFVNVADYKSWWNVDEWKVLERFPLMLMRVCSERMKGNGKRRKMKHLFVKVDLYKLPEAAAVVVSDSFGVSKSLQQRVGWGNKERNWQMKQSWRQNFIRRCFDRCYLPLFSRRCPGLFHRSWLNTCSRRRNTAVLLNSNQSWRMNKSTAGKIQI